MIYSLLLLFSGSLCCTWTATSVWTCRRRKTRWFPPSETATTAARSSGCSVTWPWASDAHPHLSPAAGALVLNDPGTPHRHQVALTSVSASAWTGYRDWSRSRFRSIMRLFPFIAAAVRPWSLRRRFPMKDVRTENIITVSQRCLGCCLAAGEAAQKRSISKENFRKVCACDGPHCKWPSLCWAQEVHCFLLKVQSCKLLSLSPYQRYIHVTRMSC